MWIFQGTKVEVVQVVERDVVELLVATGHLDVRPVSALAMDVSGVVDSVAVREGDVVEAGEVLVELRRTEAQQQVEGADRAVETARRELARASRGARAEELEGARAQVESARAGMELAEKNVARAEELYRSGLVTGADLDRARTDLEQQRAALERAQSELALLEGGARREDVAVARSQVRQAESSLELAQEQASRRVLRAPFAGLVVERNVEPGEAVSPGQEMVTLANMAEAEVYLDTDENNLVNLRKGQMATVIVAARPTERFRATVTQLGPEVNVERGTVAVRLKPESVPEDFFPDMTVDVNIEVKRIENARSLPRTAVAMPREVHVDTSGEEENGDKNEENGQDEEKKAERVGGQAYVFVVEGGRAVRRNVEILATGEMWVAVRGVEPGERVIRRVIAVDEGERVRVRGGES